VEESKNELEILKSSDSKISEPTNSFDKINPEVIMDKNENLPYDIY
jgi:hypothetical protein